jgi:hypothetical protein
MFFIDTAAKLGIDGQLRGIRAALHPAYRHDRVESEHLQFLLTSVLAADSNCIDIGAYRGRFMADIMSISPKGRREEEFYLCEECTCPQWLS